LNTVAPDFKLETQDGKQTIELKNLIGKKPIVLVFGNYTCGPFRVTYGSVEELRKRYSDEIEFVSVYVREAHPTDGWRMSFNDRSGVSLPQPRNKSERTKVASECSTALKMTMPLLVDDVDDKVGNLYSGMPSRLYLIDTDGKVAYKSGRGPFGFKPAELEQAILIHLAESTPTGKKSSLPRPSNEEAWKLLPEVANGGNQPIPIWIRTLAKSLPRTAAVMFELDAVQRTRSSLVPEWRALVRMRIAELHRCEHARLEALGDFHRLQKQSPAEYQQSLTATELSQLKKVMTFAEQLSRDGSKVEDAQVAELLKFLGNDRLTALVHVVAYANFQDRLLHSLGLASETPLETAPQEIRFKRPWVGGVTRERMLPPDRPKSVSEIDLAWKGVSYEQLQKSLEDQRCREGRIAVPAFDEMKKRLPAYYPTPTRPSRVKWSLVSLGYAPELSANWLIGLRTFGEESKQDRIFEELLFWVITREISCFY
jgi:alkylhydroperoxidase family enzyme